MTCLAAQPLDLVPEWEDADLVCTLDAGHVADHVVTDGEGGKVLATWPNDDARTMTDTAAIDRLLAEWNSPRTRDGWSGGDAVDLVGSLLVATGRLA